MSKNYTPQEFKDLPQKNITLIGMSGAGKTYLSCLLAQYGWFNYSCDYEIGSKYLKDELGAGAGITAEDIHALSDFIGKIGNSCKGGLCLDEFTRRQKIYYNAECQALAAMGAALSSTSKNFIHDSTGSLCEITDNSLIEEIGRQTLFVYLKTDDVAEKQVLKRAQEYPKPLYFPPEFLRARLGEFLAHQSLENIEDIAPDDFARWVFPLLFEARKPKYQKLADMYGVTIPASRFHNISSQEDFIDCVVSSLEDNK